MKAKCIFILITLTYFGHYIYAQTAPAIQWQKSLGGNGNDQATHIHPTPDGGYIFVGASNLNSGDVTGNHGEYDVWLVKLDHNANIQWQKSLGGSRNENSYGSNLQLTADGGFIVGVSTNSNDGDVIGYQGDGTYSNIWIVKLDSSGNIQWSKCYNSMAGSQIGFDGLKITSDGGYIITGFNFPLLDIYIIKINSTGNVQWEKTYGGNATEYGEAVQQTSDGGYIVAGETNSTSGDVTNNHGGSDIWILKLNSNGNLQWQRCYGGSQDEENTYVISQTSDNGFIFAASTLSNDGDISDNHGASDFCVFKIDGNGNINWQKCYGGSGGEAPASIKQISGGGYMIAGGSTSNDQQVSGHHGNTNRYDCWILKLTSNGNIQWQSSYGGTLDDYANSIELTSDGGYIIAGGSQSNNGDVTGHHGSTNTPDCWIVKFLNNILPIAMLNFTAQLQMNNSILRWETSTEANTSCFNVQRSIDAVHFNTINKIVAAGNSSAVKSYTYTDAGVTGLSLSKLYYRLQEVDKDGESSYSSIKTIDFAKTNSFFSVSPNPSKDFINIVSPFTVTDAQVKITDLGGKTLFMNKQNFIAGQKVKVSLSQFPSKMLIVTIKVPNGNEQFKIIKE